MEALPLIPVVFAILITIVRHAEASYHVITGEIASARQRGRIMP